jgi:hypothetical protein
VSLQQNNNTAISQIYGRKRYTPRVCYGINKKRAPQLSRLTKLRFCKADETCEHFIIENVYFYFIFYWK